jgi:hypothetical protein
MEELEKGADEKSREEESDAGENLETHSVE